METLRPTSEESNQHRQEGGVFLCHGLISPHVINLLDSLSLIKATSEESARALAAAAKDANFDRYGDQLYNHVRSPNKTHPGILKRIIFMETHLERAAHYADACSAIGRTGERVALRLQEIILPEETLTLGDSAYQLATGPLGRIYLSYHDGAKVVLYNCWSKVDHVTQRIAGVQDQIQLVQDVVTHNNERMAA